MNSVAQLLASGTVGDGDTNGYDFLVNDVIALLEKRRQHSGLEIYENDKYKWMWEHSCTGLIDVHGPFKEKKMYFSFISHIKFIYQEIIVCAFPSKMFKNYADVL